MYIELQPPLRIASLADIHFPFHDPAAIRLSLKLLKQTKPDIVILNGDIVDNYGISRFLVPPLRKAGFAAEVAYSTSCIEVLLTMLGDADIFYIEGNHEYRMRRWLMHQAPELYSHPALEIPNLYRLPKEVKYLQREEFPQQVHASIAPGIKAGPLHIEHGDLIRLHHSTINVARSMLLKTFTPLLVGHHHRVDTYIQQDYRGRLHGCWVQGCLSLPRPQYDGGRIFGQGMAIVDVYEDNTFHVENIPYFPVGDMLVAMYNRKQISIDKNRLFYPNLERVWAGLERRVDL